MTNEDIVLSIGTLKEYTSGMIKRCQDAVTLSVDSMVNKNLEQAEKIMESDDDIDLLRERLMAERTTFVIAHRLSTVRNANAIMVLENGEIIERGDHEDLLKEKGRYYRLYTGMAELN